MFKPALWLTYALSVGSSVSQAALFSAPRSSSSGLAGWSLPSLLGVSSTIFTSTNAQSASGSLPDGIDLLSITVRELQQYLTNGTITSVQLVQAYLANIEADNINGLGLRAVIETAPYDNVIAIAQQADDLRANVTILSELHGIPMLLKDNIDTDPSLGMNTTAGSYALLGSVVKGDAPVAAKLRAKGAIIIGKANLSQWANFRDGGNLSNGWSSRGGQTKQAYDTAGDPSGSSSGSAVGVAAGFCAVALGSETDGSIISPSNRAALYGIKMSVGLSSRTGVIPISSTQDTTGPMAKSAYDAALVLEIMVGYDVNDTATYDAVNHTLSNYTQFAVNQTFAGKKLGVPRQLWNESLTGNPPEINIAANAALAQIQSLGAIVSDNLTLPSFDDFLASNAEGIVLDYDFKVDLATYLSNLANTSVLTLADVINFNDANADLEFPPGECCQREFIAAVQTTGKNSSIYTAARAESFRIGATEGIDALLDQYGLDALVVPTEAIASSYPAIAGYPVVTVPLGQLNTSQPFGLSFIGRKWSEPTLISLMAAYEANFPARPLPPALSGA